MRRTLYLAICNKLLIITISVATNMSFGSKITDLININRFSYSYEVTPDVSHEDIENLTVEPAFFSVTWHAKIHKCEDLEIGPIKIAKYLTCRQKRVLMHLSCDMLRKDYLDHLLEVLQKNHICNLFVILGEKYEPSSSDFRSSQELITYIRAATGDFFCIGVAGFPDFTGHKLLQLKNKIDSGANFILTQAFFEKNVFCHFVENCKQIGITVPIIPGVFLFNNFKQLSGFIKLCKVKVSNDLLKRLNSPEDFEKLGTDVVKNLLLDVITDTGLNHYHFFTLNKLDFVSDFVKKF